MTPDKKKVVTPLQRALGELLQRVEDLERKPQPAVPTFQELFLDRSTEADALLDGYVKDRIPAPSDLSGWKWLGFVGPLFSFVLFALCVSGFMRDEARTDELARRLGKLEKPVTDGRAEWLGPLAGTAPAGRTGEEYVQPGVKTLTVHTADIFLDLDERCWLKVTDGDGRVLSAGFVPPGRREVAPGAKLPLTVRDGCPGHVSFTVDGVTANPPREPGHAENKVEVVTLGASAVKPQSYIYVVPEERWRPCAGRCA
jgi:uncharacterized protein DUF4115